MSGPRSSQTAIQESASAPKIRRTMALLLRCLLLSVALLASSWVACPAQVPVKRIGYLEAGSFWLFENTWKAFQASLSHNGDFRIEFPEDAHISPGWEPARMQTLPEQAKRLLERKDLDLVVGMGTAAVKALLAVNDGRLPILGMGMADPMAAGVVKDARDSGVDNFTCDVTVGRWASMFRVFFDVVRFHKLGIMYADSPDGRVYAALDDAQAIASELGFSLVQYKGLSSVESPEECSAGLDALRQQGMDAFFIGPLNCFDLGGGGFGPLLNKLADWKVPTFARDGSEYVKAGALMGFSTWNFGPTGDFLAGQAHAIFTGALPRSLSMSVRVEPSIALNLAVAKAIGFEFPFDVLVTADELYETTTPPHSSAP
jgi:ABC-type uncharacterized transport system substrate-binding protein